MHFVTGLNMNTDKITCPICSKEFSSAVIESHASKCLFLNESITNESSTSKDGSPARKLIKLSDSKVKKSNLSTIKRKSNFIESSSFNTDIQSSGISSNNDVIILMFFFLYKTIL